MERPLRRSENGILSFSFSLKYPPHRADINTVIYLKGGVPMLRGLYTAAGAMMAQRKRMDVLTNNLANLETPGFKKDYTVTRSFNDVLLSRLGDTNDAMNYQKIGNLTYGVHVDEVVTKFQQGPLESTGRTADMALDGDGYFVVETPKGLRYTRSGNFQVDGNGYLCTSEGYYVRGTAGRIQVGGQDFTVDTSGNVVSPAGTSRLLIVSFTDNKQLTKEGGNLYASTGTAGQSTAQVRQGFLEASNVDMAQETVDMIEVQRNYEVNQRILNMFNESLQKTVNEVGKV
jgi:flagellar basal-body rod protein FlgF